MSLHHSPSWKHAHTALRPHFSSPLATGEASVDSERPFVGWGLPKRKTFLENHLQAQHKEAGAKEVSNKGPQHLLNAAVPRDSTLRLV